MGNHVQDFRDLRVWQNAMCFVTEVYALTKSFPDSERYGLTSQIRRSAVSVPSNIAEGNRRGSTKDYVRFLRIALGSLGEVETQLMIACNIQLINENNVKPFLDSAQHIGKSLIALERALLNS